MRVAEFRCRLPHSETLTCRWKGCIRKLACIMKTSETFVFKKGKTGAPRINKLELHASQGKDFTDSCLCDEKGSAARRMNWCQWVQSGQIWWCLYWLLWLITCHMFAKATLASPASDVVAPRCAFFFFTAWPTVKATSSLRHLTSLCLSFHDAVPSGPLSGRLVLAGER